MLRATLEHVKRQQEQCLHCRGGSDGTAAEKSSFGEGDRSALIFLNRVAHMTPLERPQEVNQALSNFYLDN